jgi:uncharacterized protein (DUF427 family)
VRGVLGGETVVDSCHVALLHETGYLPIWYFPRSDVRFDLLEETEHTTHCPFKGDASYWTIRVGGKVAENKVWGYPEILPGTPPITDRVAFYWDAVEHWYEEDEEVFVHPRDPYHRVDLVPSSRNVRISLDGDVLAESSRPLACFETNLPTRWYLPKSDLVAGFEATTRSTRCPYKGIASYWSVGGNEDIGWSYEDPIVTAAALRGLVAFYDEVVDVDIDGERQERGYSPFAAAGALKDRGVAAQVGSNAAR